MHSLREPLIGGGAARPSLLGSDALSLRQQRVDERIRTLCLVVLSLAVAGLLCYYLRAILVRFVLALALKYLLTPLVDMLSCHGTSCRCKLPRGLAIVVALIIAAGGLGAVGLLVVRSISSFAAQAEMYSGRVQHLVEAALNVSLVLEDSVLGSAIGGLHFGANNTEAQRQLIELARTQVNVSALIVGFLGTAAHALVRAAATVLT